jgi:nitrous oxidase accessory protein
MYAKSILFLCFFSAFILSAKSYRVGAVRNYKTIQSALKITKPGDTILVGPGTYREGNINVLKNICFIGEGMPVLDGQKIHEVFSIRSDSVCVDGFKIINSKYSSLEDPAGIKVYNSSHVKIINNVLIDNFFGIYLQFCKSSLVQNNQIYANGTNEQEIGNGIHCWKSDGLLIIGNKMQGNRDGIYFEFVSNSVIWRNLSFDNIRYGLHFMFSQDNAYFTNYFKHNGAGVAVMYTNRVIMVNNTFEDNWGDAAYGLLLKEISDCYLSGNRFYNNTAAVFMDGTNRIHVEKNVFQANGCGLNIQANCLDYILEQNNFLGNTFDVSTNGSLTLNTFNKNYWDKYEGYDLNKDGIGDLPYHPLSLYAMIVESNPPAMLLYRSFIVSLLDKSERMMPSLTPDKFVDNTPVMRPYML